MTPVWTIRYRAGGVQRTIRVVGSRLDADRIAKFLQGGFVVPPSQPESLPLVVRVAVNIELRKIAEATREKL